MMRLFSRFLFLSILSPQVLFPMAQQPEKQIDQATIDRAVQRADAVLARMPAIMDRVPRILQQSENNERDRRAAKLAQDVEATANQNTILFATPAYAFERQVREVVRERLEVVHGRVRWIPEYEDRQQQIRFPRFALFKRDLISGALYLANFASDIMMYRLIEKYRVQRIKDYFLEHHQDVENLLTHISQESLKLDFQVEDKKISEAEALTQKTKLLGLLKTFVETEHSLQSAFFNKELIALILGRLVIERVTDGIERACISNMVPVDIEGYNGYMPLPPFMQASYEYNEAGERVQCQDAPISILSVARTINGLLFNPADLGRIFWGDLGNMIGDGLKTANAMFGLGIPKFVFDPKMRAVTRFATEVAALAFAIKQFDTTCHTRWIAYLERNHVQLLPLMQEYKSLKNSVAPEDVKKLKDIENKIEIFIREGHQATLPGSDCSRWFSSKRLGNMVVNSYQNLLFCGLIAMKGYQLYRYMTTPNHAAPEDNGVAPQPTN